MLSRWIVVVVVAVAFAACGGSSSSSAKDNVMASYKLVPANNSSAAPIAVTITLPSGWKENTSKPSQPIFEIPGLASGSRVSLTAIELTGSGDALLAKAIDDQDLTDGQRTNLSGGRAWVQKTTGPMTEARVFVPYAGGVVMGVAMIRDAGKLPDIRKAFETLTVAR